MFKKKKEKWRYHHTPCAPGKGEYAEVFMVSQQ